MWHVYILKCKGGSLYAGITTEIKRRLEQHNQAKASKYTRAHIPVKLVYSKQCNCRSTALKREAQIKKMTRKEKLTLIKDDSK
ncbi:MAG: GIY-YIG nuclease family protein [Candidatus Omnitrophota bacterium]